MGSDPSAVQIQEKIRRFESLDAGCDTFHGCLADFRSVPIDLHLNIDGDTLRVGGSHAMPQVPA